MQKQEQQATMTNTCPYATKKMLKGVDLSNPVVNVFGWRWNDATRKYDIVCTGQEDRQALVNASKGMDIKSIISKQPGANNAERLANAVNAGLVIPNEGISKDVDLTALPQDAIAANNAVIAGKKAAEKINDSLGLEGNRRFSMEELANGDADSTIKKYLDERLQALIEQYKKGEIK